MKRRKTQKNFIFPMTLNLMASFFCALGAPTHLAAEELGEVPLERRIETAIRDTLKLRPDLTSDSCRGESYEGGSGGNSRILVTCGNDSFVVVQWDTELASFQSYPPKNTTDPALIAFKDPGCFHRTTSLLENLQLEEEVSPKNCRHNPFAVPYPIDFSGPGYHESRFECTHRNGNMDKFNVTFVFSDGACRVNGFYGT